MLLVSKKNTINLASDFYVMYIVIVTNLGQTFYWLFPNREIFIKFITVNWSKFCLNYAILHKVARVNFKILLAVFSEPTSAHTFYCATMYAEYSR